MSNEINNDSNFSKVIYVASVLFCNPKSPLLAGVKHYNYSLIEADDITDFIELVLSAFRKKSDYHDYNAFSIEASKIVICPDDSLVIIETDSLDWRLK